jgi:hypothetical protein
VEIIGSKKCRIVGESQSALMMIDPIIFTRTRILCRERERERALRATDTWAGGDTLRPAHSVCDEPCGLLLLCAHRHEAQEAARRRALEEAETSRLAVSAAGWELGWGGWRRVGPEQPS